MQPSSLIFLAVIAIWGAFLVQYWVRRREDVATARSADRFSEAMHVLERRPVIAAAEPRPAFALYAAGSPLVARGTRSTATVAASPVPPVLPAEPAAPALTPSHPAVGTRRIGLPRVTPRIGRAARGVALVLTLVALPVIITAAALGLLPWTSLLVWTGVLVALLVSLRAAAVRERTRRHTSAQLRATDPSRRREAATRAIGSAARPAARPRPTPATRVVAPAAAAASSLPAAMPGTDAGALQPQPTAATAAETGPAPLPAAEPVALPVAQPEIVAFADFGVDPTSVTLGPADDDALHGQWSPVDVPPPTYTLKAKAIYPVGGTVAESAAETASTLPAGLDVVDVEDDDVPARWVVGG